MSMCLAADKRRAKARHPRDAADWLVLAASPTFALMAWLSANHAPPIALCSSSLGVLPINAMTAMYLLMSLFHLSPWLKFAAARKWALT
jgi:hypothetical protein